MHVQVKQRKRVENVLDSALSIKPVGSWISDAEQQMRAIEAAVRRELDEAAAAMDSAEPIGDATIRYQRSLRPASTSSGNGLSLEAEERMLYMATHGSRNHKQVAEVLNAQAAELEAQLNAAPVPAQILNSRPRGESWVGPLPDPTSSASSVPLDADNLLQRPRGKSWGADYQEHPDDKQELDLKQDLKPEPEPE